MIPGDRILRAKVILLLQSMLCSQGSFGYTSGKYKEAFVPQWS